MSHGDGFGRGATGVNLREAVWHEPMATRLVGIFAWTAEQAGCKSGGDSPFPRRTRLLEQDAGRSARQGDALARADDT